MSEELNALAALTFNWTRSPEEVWAPCPYHVDGLHAEIAVLISRGIGDAQASMGINPLGIAIQGQRGVGKTHLLGWTRQQVQQARGYFFLVSISSGKTFWEEVLSSIVDRLLPHPDSKQSQLELLLGDLSQRVGLPFEVSEAVTGRVPPSKEDISAFVAGLRQLDRTVGLTCQDTARALVLLASPDPEHQDLGFGFVHGLLDVDERRAWGIRSQVKSTRLVIAELSRLIALSGPTVVAVDQIDALIDEINKVGDDRLSGPERLVTEVASGLMDLRDITRRTLTVVACLPESWAYIRHNAVNTVTDRFRPAWTLQNIPSADIGYAMIAKRFAPEFGAIGFEPPYPTWPIRPEAFAGAESYTARGLLQRVDRHVAACLRDGEVRELFTLTDWTEPSQTWAEPSEAATSADMGAEDEVATRAGEEEPGPAQEELAALDGRFAELRAAADVAPALDHTTEDSMMPALLTAGLEAWVRERGADRDQAFVQDPPPGKIPPLHAALKMTVDERTERQLQWSFRAIASDNARAVLNRLRNAMTASGLDGRGGERRLFVLRNSPWPTGPATAIQTREFAHRGGVDMSVSADDLKTFAALEAMLADRHPSLNGWLIARQPAHRTELFRRVLSDVIPDRRPLPKLPRSRVSPEPVSGLAITVGRTAADQTPVSLDLASLRRHAAIFAGSGSGKTVLLRRIVEECALHGVSAIVLDPNNDLARLGDAWPQVPETWADGDAERAKEYLSETDVVVWTPRRQGGRPLTFQPLPAFADVLDDPDELNAAVDAAVEALAPRVSANKASPKANREKAVLTEALRYFAQCADAYAQAADANAATDLDDFIALLAKFPREASTLIGAPGTAADLADRLSIARINDPLFGGAGQAADPGVLLTPPPGKRARISVISLIGLEEEAQRQSFVSQLQMALFSWVKKHPAGDRPLGGLLVMDEAQTLAPAVGSTASTQSTLRLASQARKYGLGLMFATQAPKSLHNQVPGNATTQFFGLLNSPAQIDAAKQLARAKGGDVPEIGRLSRGQFYLATEGRGFELINAPMCLSYHPPSPLTEEEVIARANRSP
jgi:hypothetical protein